MLNLWKWQIIRNEWVKKSEKYTWGKCTNRAEREKKNENKFIPIQRIFHIAYCTLFCLTHKSIANSLLLWLYIIPYVIVECVTSCAIQAKMSLRLSFFFFLLAVVPHICVCIWWCTFICGRVKGLKCKKNKKNKKRERNSQERKVFVDVIYFRRGGGYGFQVLFYFICWNCELLFILYSALFMKKYKFTKHNFLYPVGDFLFIIYCIKVELLNKWTNSSRHFLLPFHHVVLKLALFYSKDEALESEWNKKHKHSKRKWFYIKYLFIEPSHRMWWKHFKIYINTFIIHCLVRHKNKGQTTTTARKNHGQFSRWSLGSFFKKNYKTLNIFATFLSYFKL